MLNVSKQCESHCLSYIRNKRIFRLY